MSISVHLPKFEGPLSLLLYLIRKEEMDIFDIKIHDITHQYLDYIKLMKELDLEMAGEFVAMAATLIHIKSKMLLPQYNDQGEIIESEDPRKELVQKLLEYQKYQEAAKILYERPLLGRDVWARGTRETLVPKEEEIVLEENALFSMIATYRRLVKSFNKKIHKVAAKAQSIASRILEIKDKLIPGSKVTLMELVTTTENRMRQALITFLSILELGKMGFVVIYQNENYSDIWIEATKIIEKDMVSRVEEYDSVNSDAMAQKILDDSVEDDQEVAFIEDSVNQTDSHYDESINDSEEMATDEELLAAENELSQSDEVV